MNKSLLIRFISTDPIHAEQQDEDDDEGDRAECGDGLEHSWYCNYYSAAGVGTPRSAGRGQMQSCDQRLEAGVRSHAIVLGRDVGPAHEADPAVERDGELIEPALVVAESEVEACQAERIGAAGAKRGRDRHAVGP